MATVYVSTSGRIAWPTSTVVSAGDRVFGSAGEQVIFECTTGGQTGGSEPAWDTTPGNTTNDNAAVWTARDFDSWANASPSMNNAAVDGIAADSDVFVDKTHNESVGATVTLNFVNGTAAKPIRVFSSTFNSSPADYAKGAKLTATGAGFDVNIQGHVQSFGVDYECTDDMNFGRPVDAQQLLDDCTLTAGDLISFATTEAFTRITNSTLICNGATAAGEFGMASESNAYLKNCVIQHPNTSTFFIPPENGRLLLEDCDLSADSTNITAGFAGNGQDNITLRRCKLKASWTSLGGGSINNPPGFILVEGCTEGTITVSELSFTQLDTYFGTVRSGSWDGGIAPVGLARYRTGGADDGENANAHSFQMETNANALELHSALECPPITRWVDPDTTPSGATSRGTFTSTRMAMQGTPAALDPAGPGEWNGSGVGTEQKITHTLNNQNGATLTLYVASGATLNNDDFWIEVHEPDQVGGPITVKCFLAKPSTTVYVDPKLTVA